MKLTIKSFQESDSSDKCFCGKDADYYVQLTNDNMHRPVCESCLLDRLNKPGQSFMITAAGQLLQSFKDDHPLFITYRVSSKDYSVSFHGINPWNGPCAIIPYIKNTKMAGQIMKELSSLGIDWVNFQKQGRNHPDFITVRDLIVDIRKAHGLL